jgi:cell division initiation protein
MSISPAEIRHVEIRRTLFGGFRPSSVLDLLAEISDSFEEVLRQRADLIARLSELEAQEKKHREIEALLRSTLMSAEEAALDLKEHARRESESIVEEAHAEARRVTREAVAEKRRLDDSASAIRAQLRTALERLDGKPEEIPAVAGPRAAVPLPVADVAEMGVG